MKLVILFYLFLAISYYIFLQRKKIIEGHTDPAAAAATQSSAIDSVNQDTAKKKEDVRILLNEVKALIEEQKNLSKAIAELEKDTEVGQETEGEASICKMTDCKTIKSNRKCSQFKIDSGIDCQ